jgi:hypothetical protein
MELVREKLFLLITLGLIRHIKLLIKELSLDTLTSMIMGSSPLINSDSFMKVILRTMLLTGMGL